MFPRNMLFAAAAFSVFYSTSLAQTTMSRDASRTTSVHVATEQGVVLESADYYGSGNDDNTAEFGVATFNLGNPTVRAVTAAQLSLTYNDRNFTEGMQVEFFYTPDSAEDLGGDFANLSYDLTKINGIHDAQFVSAPVSLGTFAFDPSQDGGLVNTFDLTLNDELQQSLLDAVTGAKDFQILVASTTAADNITFSGRGNTLNPGAPNLKLTVSMVPEPSAWLLLSVAGLCLARQRRRVYPSVTR